MKNKFIIIGMLLVVFCALKAQNQVVITESRVEKDSYTNSNVTIAGKSDLHLTAKDALINSNVYLNSTDSWLFFDNLRPSEVVDKYALNIFINNVQFNHKVNGRIAVYKHGTVVIPHNGGENFEAIQVFQDENFAGDSTKFKPYVFNNNLGTFNNSISSFKLKRGYAVVFANHEDGTGYSRVYIADSTDIEISELPVELNDNVSFVRVSYWQYPNKKGLCNKFNDTNTASGINQAQSQLNLTQSTWFYSWGDVSPDYLDYEFVTQKWGGGSTDNNLTCNVTSHFLGYNEPDASEQSKLTVERAIELWPGLLKGGLRLGSPAPVNPTAHEDWLGRFMAEAERLNYRVDYIALHCYWEQDAATWYSKLKAVYDRYKRPIWITEGHTKTAYPDGYQDGDPLTPQQVTRIQRLKDVINMLDTCSFVERYALYNWDYEGNVFVLGDFSTTVNTQYLSPLGEFYRDKKGPYFYNSKKEYVSTYKLNYNVELTSAMLANNNQVKLNWSENYDELVTYSVQRKLPAETAFTEIVNLKNVFTYTDSVTDGAVYRIKIQAITDNSSKLSNEIIVNRDVVPAAPVLSGEAISINIIDLNWDNVPGARAYTIQRSTNVNTGYTTIASEIVDANYRDINLSENTTYYYKVVAANYAGLGAYSQPLSVKTKLLAIPSQVTGVAVEPGNTKVRLDWSKLYDVTYTVNRSLSAEGPFVQIANALIDTVYFDNGLTNNTTYYYTILAVNAAGTGVASNVISAKPYVGPLAYWNFNEGQGTTSTDKINNKIATLSLWNPIGKEGAGAYFDGTREPYVTMPDGILQTVNDFTITIWLNLEDVPESARLFDFRRDRRRFMEMVLDNGDGVMHFQIRDNANTNTLDVNYKIPLNQWVHLAITQKDGFTSMYVDGDLKGTMQSAMKPSDLQLTTMNYINKSYWVNNPNIKGTIDNFNIYELAFNQENILNEMNGNDIIMGVKDIIKQDVESVITVYPNPATDQLHFKCNALTIGKIDAELFNVKGQKVVMKTYDAKSSENSMNISHLEKGLYFLRITNNTTSTTQKVILK